MSGIRQWLSQVSRTWFVRLAKIGASKVMAISELSPQDLSNRVRTMTNSMHRSTAILEVTAHAARSNSADVCGEEWLRTPTWLIQPGVVERMCGT